jgi:carbon-monoxide dehydrogenase medium subunit
VRIPPAVQTRNLGTIGGNLHASLADSGPVLVALEAVVTVAGPRGRRQHPLTEFFDGPRKSALKPDELLLEVIIPGNNLGKPADFQKFGLRKGQALALVNAAASLWVDWERGRCVAPRIALGAVAPTVIRAPAAGLPRRRAIARSHGRSGRIAVSGAPISDFALQRITGATWTPC